MRFLIASMIMCFGVAGYCQDTTSSSPEEVTVADEGSGEDVAANVDSFDCGCHKGKPKL